MGRVIWVCPRCVLDELLPRRVEASQVWWLIFLAELTYRGLVSHAPGSLNASQQNAKLQRMASFMKNLTLTSMAAKSASSSDADAP